MRFRQQGFILETGEARGQKRKKCKVLSFVEPGGVFGFGVRNVPPVTKYLSRHGAPLHRGIEKIILKEIILRELAGKSSLLNNHGVGAGNN